MQNETQILQLTDIFRSRTFGALNNIKTYPIILGDLPPESVRSSIP
jgi:hypothetical protein